MMFFILFLLSGFTLTTGTYYLFQRFKKEWKMPKGFYTKAGLSLLIIEIFHIAVLDGLISYFPQFDSFNIIIQGLVLGIFGGLFFELGRFFVLDKIMKTARSYKEVLYFGLGWNGVATFLLGVLIIIGSYGLYMLISTNDLASLFPTASGTDLESVKVYQDEALDIINNRPYIGLAPIFERGSLLLMDILLSLLIVLGFHRMTTSYVWIAVLIRASFIFIVYVGNYASPLAALGLYVVTGIIAFKFIQRLKETFARDYLSVES